MLIWNLPPMITPTKRFGLGLIYSLGGAISGTPKRRPLHWCADRWQIAIACLCGRSAERGRRIREKEGSQPGGVAKKYRKGPDTIVTGPRGKKRNYLTDIVKSIWEMQNTLQSITVCKRLCETAPAGRGQFRRKIRLPISNN